MFRIVTLLILMFSYIIAGEKPFCVVNTFSNGKYKKVCIWNKLYFSDGNSFIPYVSIYLKDIDNNKKYAYCRCDNI